MATRNENTETRQQSRENAQNQQSQQAASQQGTAGGTASTERERGLQTAREDRTQTGMVRPGGRGLTGAASARTPFALMRRMMDDMDRMFEDFGTGGLGLGRDLGFGRSLFSPLLGGTTSDPWAGSGGDIGTALWAPPVEVLERGDKILVRAELPGVSKDDVNVSVADDVLTIEGERRQEHEDRGEGFYRSERSYGRFFRSIPLPEGADADKADASFKDGILEITVPAPKLAQKRGRKLAIR